MKPIRRGTSTFPNGSTLRHQPRPPKLEAMHVIRKGQIRWLAKGDVVGQRHFIHTLFGIAV